MGLSNSEEKAKRHATKAEHKLTIELYRKHAPCLHVDSRDLCSALRRENPKLAKVFAQIDASVDNSYYSLTLEDL